MHTQNPSRFVRILWIGLLLALGFRLTPVGVADALGIFEGHTDIGAPSKAGSAQFDPDRKTYRITGGGENMWFAADQFHFVWKRMSGNLSLAATVEWAASGGNAHRKACLLIRQSLEPDSAYADAVIHGDGLCSLQYREIAGAPTREIQSNLSAPARIRIEKEGRFVAMSVARAGEALRSAGGSFKIQFREPFYVGLGVCAHDDGTLETALFSEVELVTVREASSNKPVLESTLETVAIASKDRRVVYHTRGHIEAPNWLPGDRGFLFNSNGRIYSLPRQGGVPQMVDTGFADRCNNDHGISPDGKQLAISHHGDGGKSLIYVVPIEGGTPVQVTTLGPSYWHGWSPDGMTLAYCAEREGNFDVYTIAACGGPETRLTTAGGLDDGPEYSPDGRFIYFNSERTGSMKIWRMEPDGSGQEQVTFGELNDWFPHPSPDGKWLVFLSYGKEVQGHPANQDVQLRLLPVGGGEPQVLAKLFGGQGTINVPSWSPDSRNVAFVSYRLVRGN
ncbi:MAG: TolB family protein [Verrucomicrobiia bacterium]